MIIKYIELKNFRQFKGKQRIDFSSDPNKKATLIIAKNTTGKTTLLEAFSWILYGTCNLKSVRNSEIDEMLAPNHGEEVSGEICLMHLSQEYRLIRTMKYWKANTKISNEDPYFKILTKDKQGITKEFGGLEAKKLVNQIVPQKLFPYFFFKGESIEKIGKEISGGKNSKNSEFVKAIRGMLGFDYLYQTINDLEKIVASYQTEIAHNTSDKKLSAIQSRINQAIEEINKYNNLIKDNDNNIHLYESERKQVSDEILKSGDVAGKQKQAIQLTNRIGYLKIDIASLEKDIFAKFSSKGHWLLAREIIDDSLKLLKEHGDIDKGIPGLNASAVKYLLNKKECICGTKIEEGDDCWNALTELIKYLPPNNLGAEISKYESMVKLESGKGDDYLTDYIKQRKDLEKLRTELVQKVKELEEVDNAIKNHPDMTKKKMREQELYSLINMCSEKRGTYKFNLKKAEDDKTAAEKEKSQYDVLDKHTAMLKEYEWQANRLLMRLKLFCNKKEKEKRLELQEAINQIFLEIFDIDITLSLTDDYGIELKSGDNMSLDDFENSTSQDAIMAFSFIGGIIKLARNKTPKVPSPDDGESIGDVELEVEPYPLVMDAPSSSFDIERIENFCKIMPSIAEQVIFFIKDTDGNYVRKDLLPIIGKEYAMDKISKTETIVTEVK